MSDGRSSPWRHVSLAIALGACLLLAAAPARAADPPAPGEWRFGAEIYLWGAAIDATSVTGGDVHIGFDTIVRDLDMGFMGAFGARNGKWSILLDAIYLDISQDSAGYVTPPGGASVPVSTAAKLKGWIVTPAVGYNLVDTEQGTLDVLGGARYLTLRGSLDLNAAVPPVSLDLSNSGSVWDAIVGVRGRVNLAPEWYLPYYADIGTGDSKLTWQAFAGVAYRFKSVDAVVGYRYLKWDFKSSAAVLDDLALSGPLLGFKFAF